MKKKVALLLALIMVFALFAAGCGSSDDNGGADGGEYAGTVKIGVFEPASGENGAGGKQETLGVQYANKVQPTVDINGETYKVELVTADNESDNSKGITAAQNLVSSGVSSFSVPTAPRYPSRHAMYSKRQECRRSAPPAPTRR